MSSSECVICMEDMKKKNTIECPFCDFSACKTCVRESLLFSVNDPQCPSPDCKHTWSYEFCIDNLTKSFINGPFRERTRKILFDVEKSKIPATMPIIENMIKQEELVGKEQALKTVIQDLKEQMWKYEQLLYNTREDRNKLKYTKNIKKTFKKKCPKDGCGGFLSTNHKCALCNSKVCKDCNEIIIDTENGGGESKTNHVCDADVVSTLKLIQQETKPCPGCFTAIYKINGCDQMWCTHCKIPFSWKTGEKVTGVIHNPHYYQWRQTNRDTRRNVGEVLCGGVIDFDIVNRLSILSNNFKSAIGSKYNYTDNNKDLKKILSRPERYLVLPIFKTAKCQYIFFNFINEMHRKIHHFQHVELNLTRQKCNERDTLEKSRIEYIRGELNEKKFKSRIIRQDNTRRKNMMILHVFEMLYVTYLETYNDLVSYFDELSKKDLIIKNCKNYYNNNKKIFDDAKNKISISFERMNNLISYSNKELWKISKLLNLSVPMLNFPYTTSYRYDTEGLYVEEKNGKKIIKNINDNCHLFNVTHMEYSYWNDRQSKWIYKRTDMLFKSEVFTV